MRFNQYHRLNTSASSNDLTRAFALVGLIRDLDNSVPNDLVYLYLRSVDCSGLLTAILEMNDSKTSQQVIPESLKTMARNFMLSRLESHLSSVVEKCIERPGLTHFDLCSVYPDYVKQLINGVVITQYSTLKDIKPSIDALHAALTSESLNKPVVNTACIASEKTRNWSALEASQFGKLKMMYSLLVSQLRSDSGVKCYILDPYAKQTLCNLIDILLVLCPKCVSYAKSIRLKLIYDYARMAEVQTSRVKDSRFIEEATKLHDVWTGAIDDSINIYSKFSPQAVVCLGYGIRKSMITSTIGFNDSLSWKKTPTWFSTLGNIYKSFGKNCAFDHLEQFINKRSAFCGTRFVSVKLYVKAEIDAERQNIYEYLQASTSSNNYCRHCDDEVMCGEES